MKANKIACITGATSGIGQATAEILAANGVHLIITGRRKNRLIALQARLKKKYDISVLPLAFDVRIKTECDEALATLKEQWKSIDILVNNAGLAKGLAPIQEGNFEHWEAMIDTNIKGILYMTRLISPDMVNRRKGHIINIASTAAKEVYPDGNVYCATKHAVEALTKAMRIDLHKYNIRVSQVAPGAVEETEFTEVRFDGDKKRAQIYDDFNPLTSRDVAEAIYFIISRPPHVNIQDILIMGTQQASATIIDKSGRR